jgi:thiamine pyrophosphokinase
MIPGGDLIIAADGGARHCLWRGIQPDVVIGDFDSLSEAELAVLQEAGAEIIRHPRRKDFTDLELALLLARERGAQQAVVLAGLGQRWDQTLANLLLPTLSTLAPMQVRMVDGRQEIFLIHSGDPGAVSGRPGDTVSLIPLSQPAKGISTIGLEYPLVDGELSLGSTRGISNVLLGSSAKITVREGLLLCVVIHQE